MTDITSLAQILSLVLLVLLAIVMIRIVPKISRKISVLISWRRSFILSGVYLGVLIIVIPVLYILPIQGLIPVTDGTRQTQNAEQQKIIEHMNAQLPAKLKLDEQQGLYRSSNQIFEVDSEKLAFSFSPNKGYPIFIDTKDVDDGKIEVSTYLPNRLATGVNYKRLLLPPTISLQDGTLSIIARQQVIDYKQFKADFTADQFNGPEKESLDWNSTFFGYGSERIIYIQVPKNLEVDLDKYKGQVQLLHTIK